MKAEEIKQLSTPRTDKVAHEMYQQGLRLTCPEHARTLEQQLQAVILASGELESFRG